MSMSESKSGVPLSSDLPKSVTRSTTTVRRIGKYGILATDVLLLFLFFLVVRRPTLPAPLVTYDIGTGGKLTTVSSGLDWFLIPCLIFVVYAFFEGHYSRRRPFWEEARRTIKLLLTLALVDLAVLEVARIPGPLWLKLGQWGALAVILPLTRLMAKRVMAALNLWQMRTVIIGVGEDARQTCLMLRQDPSLGYAVTAFIDVGDMPSVASLEITGPDDRLPLLHCVPDHLPHYLMTIGAPHPVFVLGAHDERLSEAIDNLTAKGQIVDIVPNLRGTPLLGLEVSHMFGREAAMLHTSNNLSRPVKRVAKRLVDLFGAGFGLILLAPLLLTLSVLIRREDGGPAIYRQKRVGRSNKDFMCLKFRSMHIRADAMLEEWRQAQSPEWLEYVAQNHKLRDDPRVTRIGRFLRRTSLDELPQLINVLRGEMSLVGPRPLIHSEVPDFGRPFRHYVRVRPGITGLWQVSGRSDASLRDRAAYDDWYVKNWSLWYDIVILLRTVAVVVGRHGAY